MSSNTLLYIIIAGITALLLALFQYLYKSNKIRLNFLFTFLRFLSYFTVFLLLINPKLENITLTNVKPKLILAVDNSESIKHLSAQENLNNAVANISNDNDLADKFDITTYAFGDDINLNDSITNESQLSNISKSLIELDKIYDRQIAPFVLLSDGNQTLGTDYEFTSKSLKQNVFPVVIGDTTQVEDLSIEQINVNKYAFLDNRFPVEISVLYNGNKSVSKQLRIVSGSQTLFRENINFTAQNNSKVVNTTLLANTIGSQYYSVIIDELDNEKNTKNNRKQFAIEVVDEKTNIAIVSAIKHPDIATLKKVIESNQQRTVDLLIPNEAISKLDSYQLAILYQPDTRFNEVFNSINKLGLNTFTITGKRTDWEFLNKIQDNYTLEVTNQTEEYQPSLNVAYPNFIVEDYDFSDFPPLKSSFGELITNKTSETLFYKTLRGISTSQPMLLTFEENNNKQALLLGEGIWRWRAHSYLHSNDFKSFDDFFGKLIQYLSSQKKRSRLQLDYKSFYEGNYNVKINAQYFNKNYELDKSGELKLILKNLDNDKTTTFPFVLSNINYQVDLSGIEAGNYSFTVTANTNEISRSGKFTVIDYNLEQQYSNANYSKLLALSNNTKGSIYLSTEIEKIKSDLLSDTRYKTIQKSDKKVVPLIDFKILLGLLVLLLSSEWFIRKYNGLI